MIKHNEVVLLETRLAEVRESVFPNLSDDALFQRDAVDTVLRHRELTYQELDDGVVDGQDDGGVDAVYIFLNGELVSDESSLRVVPNPTIELDIFQVKNETGFAETPLQKLIDHLPQLTALAATDDELRVEFNERVVERFGLFRKVYLLHATKMPRLTIRVLYVSKSVQDPNSKVEMKRGRLADVLVASFPSADVTIEFLGPARLNVLARERPNKTLELKLAEQPLAPSMGGIVALVRLGDFVNFIREESGVLRESIFEENVRGYEGSTNINKGIADSLAHTNESIDFWWLNNGITIIGTAVSYAQKKAAIADPQIVNGLQTSRAIFNYFEDIFADDDDERHVLVRIIETDVDTVSAQIIKATNSQNRVPSASLRAAEPFQRAIEEYLLTKGRFYERRRNHYKNQGKRRADIVSVSELAQAVASIALAMPNEARGRPGSLVRDKNYPKVFNEKSPLEFFWRCLEIMDAVEAFLRDEKDLSRQERSNVRYHLARVAVAVAVTSSRPAPASVIRVDASLLSDHLEVVYEWLIAERDKAASDLDEDDFGTLAKSKEFADHINSRLSRYSAKQKWPKMLHSGWALAKP